MLTAHLHCSYCNDTWFRELIDQEVQAYIEEHPELEKKILSGEITDIDLEEVLCDGCEDFHDDEAALAEALDDWPYWVDLDDISGTHCSWLCEQCGDVAYDCGCDDEPGEDIEDEIDRMADFIAHGRL